MHTDDRLQNMDGKARGTWLRSQTQAMIMSITKWVDGGVHIHVDGSSAMKITLRGWICLGAVAWSLLGRRSASCTCHVQSPIPHSLSVLTNT